VNTIQNWSNEFNKWTPERPKHVDIMGNATSAVNGNVRVNKDVGLGVVAGYESSSSISQAGQVGGIIDGNIEQSEPSASMRDNGESAPYSSVSEHGDEFPVIKQLLDDMVNFIDVSAASQPIQNTSLQTAELDNDEDDDKFRSFNVFLIDAQKTWPDRISIIGMNLSIFEIKESTK